MLASQSLSFRQLKLHITKAGVLFLLIVGVMLFGAVNYRNNLGHLFSFLLISLGLLSMIHAYRNLLKLSIRIEPAEAVFVGHPAYFKVHIDNPQNRAYYAINIQWQQQKPYSLDIPPQQSNAIDIAIMTKTRGKFQPKEFLISSIYPLGFFQVEYRYKTDVTVIVYPKASKDSTTHLASQASQSDQGKLQEGMDDFMGLRNYHPGDPLKYIHWKALASSDNVLIKQFGGHQIQQLWIDWDQTPPTDTETRLSYLCRWLLDADQEQYQYGLRLPNKVIHPDSGEHHLHRCLQALALF